MDQVLLLRITQTQLYHKRKRAGGHTENYGQAWFPDEVIEILLKGKNEVATSDLESLAVLQHPAVAGEDGARFHGQRSSADITVDDCRRS